METVRGIKHKVEGKNDLNWLGPFVDVKNSKEIGRGLVNFVCRSNLGNECCLVSALI